MLTAAVGGASVVEVAVLVVVVAQLGVQGHASFRCRSPPCRRRRFLPWSSPLFPSTCNPPQLWQSLFLPPALVVFPVSIRGDVAAKGEAVLARVAGYRNGVTVDDGVVEVTMLLSGKVFL